MPAPIPAALALLETRRTVPNLQLGEPGPNDAEIRRLITIAARVPDHGKLTPWRFVLYRGDARVVLDQRLTARYRVRFPDAPPEKVLLESTRFSRVPVTIGVISTAKPHPKIPEWEQVLSAGASAMNLLIAAHASGYSAQWLTDWCCYDDEGSAMLGARPGERFVALIAIGTPTLPPVDRPRPAVEDVLTEWTA